MMQKSARRLEISTSTAENSASTAHKREKRRSFSEQNNINKKKAATGNKSHNSLCMVRFECYTRIRRKFTFILRLS